MEILYYLIMFFALCLAVFSAFGLVRWEQYKVFFGIMFLISIVILCGLDI